MKNGSEAASGKKSSTSSSSRSNINSGGGSAMSPDPEKEPRSIKGSLGGEDSNQRKIDTPQMQTALKDEKISSGEWHACSDWKKTYESADKTTRF